jgi:hypothetical protein
MHMTNPTRDLHRIENEILKPLLHVAKSLHRAARSESRLQSLPILRRLISSETFRQISLPELHCQRAIIQRKHILQMLALEAGFCSWSEYKRNISTQPAEQHVHYSIALRYAGYPNIWFTSILEAEEYSAEHGGQPITVGKQAVVIPSE